MNEDKLETSVSQGQRAHFILEDPIINEFFKQTEESLLNGIRASQYNDSEGRENLYRMLKVLTIFRQFFERYVAEGKIAADMLDRLKAGAFDNL